MQGPPDFRSRLQWSAGNRNRYTPKAGRGRLRAALLLPALVAAAPAAGATSGNSCEAYVGQTISPVPIAKVMETLPAIPTRDAYESTASYQKRLEEVRRTTATGPVMIDRPWGAAPPIYNPDRAEIPIYAQTFGLNRLDFREVLSLPWKVMTDAFGGIGFEVTSRVSERSSYEAVNGFGAKVAVTHREEQIDAVWEGPLKTGENPFVGKRSRGPLMTLSLNPARARDLIERGGAALLAVPLPPFRQDGSTSLAPTFSHPSSYTKHVRVLFADVRCALVYDGSRNVVAAFAVR